MRSRFAIAFVALSFALSCFSSHAGAQVASHVQQLQPDPYGLRGWIAQDHVRVTVNGIPVAYQWVDFYGYALGAFGNPGVGVRYLGSAHTDANGVATFNFQIPNDTRWSNVYLDAIYWGTPQINASFSEVRVRIGATQPN